MAGLSLASPSHLSRKADQCGLQKGGKFTAAGVEEAQKDPFLEQKLAVRRWDDQAKVPGLKVAGLEAYEDITVRCLLTGATTTQRSMA
jgi:predicted HD phosphohydrolase